MHRNAQLSSWSAFLHVLHSRFASSTYEDPTRLLCKLQQRSSVSEYLSEFESLANRVVGLPATFVLSCFISGLNPSICREVQVREPVSLAQAVAYARLQEEKLLDSRRQQTPRSLVITPSSRAATGTTNSSYTNSLSRGSNPSIPFKRLTPEELAVRQEKGLCFHCEEKYSWGHKCAPSLFLLVAEDDQLTPEVVSRSPSPTDELLREPPPA